VVVLVSLVSLGSDAAIAQVTSITTPPPVLSPVATWAAVPPGGPVAQASLSILINSGAVQSIPALLDNRINSFPLPVSVTTQWQLSPTPLLAQIDLVGYFAQPTAALTTGTTHIASSRVEGRMTSGRPANFTPFTQQPVAGNGTPGGTLHLFRQLIITPINGNGQRTDNLDLRLDLRGQPSLAAGVYRGTLTLRAVAY
jgi:hypothetical protein